MKDLENELIELCEEYTFSDTEKFIQSCNNICDKYNLFFYENKLINNENSELHTCIQITESDKPLYNVITFVRTGDISSI